MLGSGAIEHPDRMSAQPRSAAPATPSRDQVLDARLRDWFEQLTAQPVPETLLRHLDQLSRDTSDDQSAA